MHWKQALRSIYTKYYPRVFILLLLGLATVNAAGGQGDVLAKVDLASLTPGLELPIHARLQDGAGKDYLIVLCPEDRLSTCTYQVLDHNPRLDDYVLARAKRAGAQVTATIPVLLDDGIRLLLRATLDEVETLAEKGFVIRRLSASPLAWTRTGMAPSRAVDYQTASDAFSPDPRIADLMARVQQSDLLALLSQLSGEEAVVVEGEPCVIATRHTRSGTPLQKATQFAYEQMQALGLTVSFHNWSLAGIANRNVVGVQNGTVRSNEVVLVTAHIDNMPNGVRAPGADDNASGSAAVLMAARISSQLHFERTVRYILFTGEEQGLLGSEIYAAAAASAGENVVAVLNLDMLAWDGAGDPVMRLHTRTPSTPGYASDLQLAMTFTNVVASYGLSHSIIPVITSDADDASDHASFWAHNYAAVCAEEDYPEDFNPYYHTVNDTAAQAAPGYFTAITRAAVGTLAHLACLDGAVPVDARATRPMINNERFSVTFNGVPGLNYTVQSAFRVVGPWSAVTNILADATGNFEFKTIVEPGISCFYRLVRP